MSLSLFTKLITTGRGIKESGYDYENQMDGVGNGEAQLTIVEPKVVNVFKMDRSTYHTIYMLSDRRVLGTGHNGYGQLGLGNGTLYTNEPMEITSVTRKVNEIICGGYHTFFLMRDNSVMCTGMNDYGQLGLGDTSIEVVYEPVSFNTAGLEHIKTIYCGGYHTFFKLENGDVYACGKNDYGQLGLGTISRAVTTPTKLPLKNIKSIHCGSDFTYFILNDGKILSCGYNGYGELGLGTGILDNKENPTEISTSAFNKELIKDIQCGAHHTLFLMTDRTVYGCGQNEYGQLGLGDYIETTHGAINKLDISNIRALYTDAYTSIFQQDTINLYGCGQNEFGELGLGDNQNRYFIQKLLYTDIWLDELSEDIIIIPPFDKNKKALIVDGKFISNIDDIVICLDKDLVLHVFDANNFSEIDTYYFYIEEGVLKYTKNENLVYEIVGSKEQRKYDVDSQWECIANFYSKNLYMNYEEKLGVTVEFKNFVFSINNSLFIYKPKTKYLQKISDMNALITSISCKSSVTYVGNSNHNEEYYIHLTNSLYSLSWSESNTNLDGKATLKNIGNIANVNALYSDYFFPIKLTDFVEGCNVGFKDNKLVFFLTKTPNTLRVIDIGERITTIYSYNNYIYVGTRSGCLYITSCVEWLTTTGTINLASIKMKLFKKFRGEIASLKIQESKNQLNKTLIIDDNSRFLIIGFTDGRYIKYPLYRSPRVEFRCDDVHFIDDKIYYHLHIKLYDYDPLYYANMRFLIHNAYNERVYKLTDIMNPTDNVYEFNTTVSFDNVSTNIYSYIRLNYIYGNNSLGSVYQKMGIIKENLLFYRKNRISMNLSNYSDNLATVILEAIKVNEITGEVIDSKEVGRDLLTNAEDHQFLYFDDKDKLFANGYSYFNLYAENGDATFVLRENYPVMNIIFKDLVEETSYNGNILSNFDIIFNKLYESKNLSGISIEYLVNTLDLLSRKKLEHVSVTNDQKLSSDVTNDSYGNTIPFLNNNKPHYMDISNPTNVRLREHYRSNVYINGLKVPYSDMYNNIDIENNMFTTYYNPNNTKTGNGTKYTDVTLYQESLILSEKELWSYNISRYDNDVDRLVTDGIDIYLTSLDSQLDESYLSVYMQFRHTVFWSRVNTSDFTLQIVERTSSYVKLHLKINNQVLIQIGNIIHVCINDLDKRNTVMFTNPKNRSTGVKYRNYYTPLVYINESGSLITYYSEKSENIEVYIDGFMLTPYVDYKVVNLPLHLRIPTMIVFTNPVKNDVKIEISILKENFIDCIIKKCTKGTNPVLDLNNESTTMHLGTNFVPLLYNSYDMFIDGIKVPRLSEDGRKILNAGVNFTNDSKWEYIRFYLEDTPFVKFLITMLKYKLLGDSSIKLPKPNNIGDVTAEQYKDITPAKIQSNIYEDLTDEKGKVYMIIEHIDSSFDSGKNAVFDCNDPNALKLKSNVHLDSSIEFLLPYIEDDLQIDSNNPVSVVDDYLNEI